MSNRLNILIVMITELSVFVFRPSRLEGPGDHLMKLIAFKIDAAENEVFVFVPGSFVQACLLCASKAGAFQSRAKHDRDWIFGLNII